MKNICIHFMMFISALVCAAEDISETRSQSESVAQEEQEKMTAVEMISKVAASYDQMNEDRIRRSKENPKAVVISDLHKKELKHIVYLMQDVYDSPLDEARKKSIANTLETSVFLRCKPYKGSAEIYIGSLVPDLSNEETQLFCVKLATGRYGETDSRCVKLLRDLLNSSKYHPSNSSRLVIYRGLMDWATNEELKECFKQEYHKNIPIDLKYELAVQLAWLGDSTGAPTLIERLEANKDQPLLRTVIRAVLIKLYSVDLGDDLEAWKRLVNENSVESD